MKELFINTSRKYKEKEFGPKHEEVSFKLSIINKIGTRIFSDGTFF